MILLYQHLCIDKLLFPPWSKTQPTLSAETQSKSPHFKANVYIGQMNYPPGHQTGSPTTGTGAMILTLKIK